MEAKEIIEIKATLAEQGKTIQEIKRGQDRISAALIGSLEDDAVGLIEQSRNLRREVSELNKAREINEAQIIDLMAFKSDIKKIVAGIAVVIPFLFEIVKLGVSAVWEVISK